MLLYDYSIMVLFSFVNIYSHLLHSRASIGLCLLLGRGGKILFPLCCNRKKGLYCTNGAAGTRPAGNGTGRCSGLDR